jgi:hypothetical protein
MSDLQTTSDNSTPSASASDNLNLRVTYLHAGNPRPPHHVGAISTSTTIGDLKSKLQADLLEHPRPEEQRLIYQGRPLMDNTASLRDALRLDGPVGPLPYTIHIIIQPRQASSHFRPPPPPQPAQPNHLFGQMPPVPQFGQQPLPHDTQPGVPQPPRLDAIRMMQRQVQPLNDLNELRLRQTMGPTQQNFSATFQYQGNVPPIPSNIPLGHFNAPPAPVTLTGRLGAHLNAANPPFQRPSSAPGHPRHHSIATPTAGNPLTPAHPGISSVQFSHLPHPFTLPSMTTSHSTQPTVWLASSRNGPQALLFAPGHGYFSSYAPAPQSAPAPTPTVTQRAPGIVTDQPRISPPQLNPPQGQVALRLPAGNPRQAQRNQNQPQNGDDIGAFVLRRGWLFLRLYMFIYVLSEPATWRRYLLLTLAAIFCMLPSENPLNQLFAAARRHIDNLIGPPQPQARARQRDGAMPGVRQPVQAARTGAQIAPNNANQPANAQNSSTSARPNVRGAVNLTPEQAAERILRDQQGQTQSANIFRDIFYRLEQAVALFLASLIPGVGERHVAAREEARREAERERLEAQRAREEAEAELQKRKEEEEKEKRTTGDEKIPDVDVADKSKGIVSSTPASDPTSVSQEKEHVAGESSRSLPVE